MNTLRKLKGHGYGHKYTRKGLLDAMKDLNIDEYSAKYLVTELDTMHEKWQRDHDQMTDTPTESHTPTNWDI